MLRLWLRMEPTTDPERACAHKRDSVLYYDERCTMAAGIIPWDRKRHPRIGRRFSLNCYRWLIERGEE